MIYVIEPVDTRIARRKIGFTARPDDRRLLELNAGSPIELRLVFSVEGTIEDEHRLHGFLRHHRVSLVGRKEWFHLREEVARDTATPETLVARITDLRSLGSVANASALTPNSVPAEGKRRLVVDVDDDFHLMLKLFALTEKTTIQKVVVAAMTEYLEREESCATSHYAPPILSRR